MKITRPRDLAIDAAIHALIRLADPSISSAEIQRRGGMVIGDGNYTVKLDGEPVCHVELDGSRRFSLTLLAPQPADP